MGREPGRWPEWLASLVLAWAASATIIYFASGMRKLFGERGLIAVERLMGMVFITVSIQMLMTGVGVAVVEAAKNPPP